VEIEKQTTTVKEEEVDAALARLAESFAQVHPVMDRDRVEQGDVVTLDYASSLDGRPIPGLQGRGRLVEIGKETLLPGFQEHLLGVRKGETVQFSLPLPESSDAQSGTERLAHFRVTVLDVARKEVPPLDDEFAKDHGECDTLEELREKVRHNLQQAADRRAENEMENALITRLLSENSFEVPPSLVREQTQRILIEAGVVRPGGDTAASEAALPESVREELTTRARQQVQTAFLLDALAKQLGLAVSDEEVQLHIADLASTVGVDRQPQLEAFYARSENRHALQTRLLHEKVLRTVVDKATIKTIQKDIAGGEEKD
jgi:trigger factor